MTVGLLGIAPNTATRTITTCSHLPEQTQSVEIAHLLVFDNWISVKHSAKQATQLRAEHGSALRWQAKFPGRIAALWIDGVQQAAQQAVTFY